MKILTLGSSSAPDRVCTESEKIKRQNTAEDSKNPTMKAELLIGVDEDSAAQ